MLLVSNTTNLKSVVALFSFLDVLFAVAIMAHTMHFVF